MILKQPILFRYGLKEVKRKHEVGIELAFKK